MRRQRIQFAAWCGRAIHERYSMLPIFLIPPLALFLALQAAQLPDLPKWADWGGFAVLSVYMVYRYERLVKTTADEMKIIHERAETREETLITVLRDNSSLNGRLLDAVQQLMSSRFCPVEAEDHPAKRRRT
jgi:hypothetical protein